MVEGKVESAAEPGREMTSGSCDNGNRDSDDSSRGNNTKLLDHDNDSRRISAFSLRRYSENSVNNDKLNRSGAIDNYMPIPLALIAFSNGTNLENFFETFVSVIYSGVLVLNIISE